ncbi:MAG: glycosyltransferase family 2 protein, partial [Myxococcales bacterium]|nr:glycosyltransferase family 2 protein [Myxococcales bacterium]
MAEPAVCIVVTPRQRSETLLACLEHLVAFTPEPFEAWVVDPGFPEPVGRELSAFARRHAAFHPLPTDGFVHPFEAKNRAVAALPPDAEWVVFLDNDVLVEPGWLAWLLRAARETGANVVHPLYLQEVAGRVSIHMAEGRFAPCGEGREPRMTLAGEALDRARGLVRGESDFVEFHGFMIRRETLHAAGPFEPFTLGEHLNYSLILRERLGERIVFEPRAVVRYRDDPAIAPADRPYHRFRWDLALGERSIATLRERWPVMGDYFRRNLAWMKANHERALA